ncbi:GntR family transcriptional regulator [Schlesneria paludicola]|uniref:GntR family transcriptional regulator n=1 Tax=Schlesneria paludicola TaxID=360056 RepID=UPI00029AB2D9|nr:GntR family transcriptional regulator [Schlesneria paludicola]
MPLMLIATYIKDDLAARLKSGHGLPAPLTIDSLAAHYDVSFTPVRTALAELIEEGLLEKGPNRRLVVRQPQGSSPEELHAIRPPTPPSRPRDPFEVVANDLVQLSLQGRAVYLREEVTAEKYEISRSAIRNILHRLAGEGMLDHIPRRGWRLRPFRQNDLQAFVEVREVLELKALELARPKLVNDELQRMLDANPFPASPDAAPQIDESLHQYLINTAGNTYIRDFFARQGRYFRLMFQWEDHAYDIAVETIRQHREILTALIEGRWTAARKALSYHILHNHPILSRVAAIKATRPAEIDQETA